MRPFNPPSLHCSTWRPPQKSPGTDESMFRQLPVPEYSTSLEGSAVAQAWCPDYWSSSNRTQGAFHYAKISGNLGRNINGTLRSRWNFSGKSGPPPEVVHFDWSKILVFSPTSLRSNRNFGRNVNGTPRSNWEFVSIEKWLPFFHWSLTGRSGITEAPAMSRLACK